MERSSKGWPGCGRSWWVIKEEFVGTLTEKLLAYALGRGVEYYDLPAVRAIGKSAAAH